jgi:hypothetical protein
MRVEAEFVIDDDSGLPTDSAYGYGAVEIKLTKFLDQIPLTTDRPEQ